MTPRLVLFDIDGTLLLSGGAGWRSMDRAFFELFGVANAFADVSTAGRTDRWLAGRALERHGLGVNAARLDAFRALYLEHLSHEIGRPGHGVKGLMPGVAALLDALDSLDEVQSALLTGNYEGGARVKLEHFGLWHRFAWGAFGDEHAERDDLARAAVALAPQRGITLSEPSHAVVIGDTPYDVACARAAGARVIAVATGSHTVAELRACAPDLALDDLTDVAAVVDLITRQ